MHIKWYRNMTTKELNKHQNVDKALPIKLHYFLTYSERHKFIHELFLIQI